MLSAADLTKRVLAGDQPALAEFFDCYRDRLLIAVSLRMDQRVRGRMDPADVLQEVYVEASRRLPEFCRQGKMPPYLWLRTLALQRLLILHRHHLGAQARDARRDVSLDNIFDLEVSGVAFAAQLISSGTTPSRAAARAEEASQLHEALDRLEPADREMLALRHFEQLSNAEAAEVLQLSVAAASQRYYRALKRLKEILDPPPASST